MNIDDVQARIRAIAARRKPITSFCAVRAMSEKQVQDWAYKRLWWEYCTLDDDKKEKWLHDQETT